MDNWPDSASYRNRGSKVRGPSHGRSSNGGREWANDRCRALIGAAVSLLLRRQPSYGSLMLRTTIWTEILIQLLIGTACGAPASSRKSDDTADRRSLGGTYSNAGL